MKLENYLQRNCFFFLLFLTLIEIPTENYSNHLDSIGTYDTRVNDRLRLIVFRRLDKQSKRNNIVHYQKKERRANNIQDDKLESNSEQFSIPY